MTLGERIKEFRHMEGLSQEGLAEKLNVSRQAISRWEGTTAQPDAANILQLSKLFGVTTDYLLNDEYEKRGLGILSTTDRWNIDLLQTLGREDGC